MVVGLEVSGSGVWVELCRVGIVLEEDVVVRMVRRIVELKRIR